MTVWLAVSLAFQKSDAEVACYIDARGLALTQTDSVFWIVVITFAQMIKK